MARKGVVLVGLVLLAAATGVIMARRGDTGARLRSVTISGGVGAVVVDERTGRVFVSTSNNVDVFDARSGDLPHGVAVDPGVLAVAERAGRIFVVGSNMNSGSPGTVSVLNARSGRLIRTSAAGPVPYAVAVDERAGRAFVLNANNGGVGVFDAASGRFLGTFNDGPNDVPAIAPFTLAVDARRARLFVITGDIFGHSPGTRLSVLDTRSGRLVRIPRVGMYRQGWWWTSDSGARSSPAPAA